MNYIVFKKLAAQYEFDLRIFVFYMYKANMKGDDYMFNIKMDMISNSRTF